MLRQVDGLTGIEADPGEVTMSVKSDADLMPVAGRALQGLASAEVESSSSTALRYVVEGGGASLVTSLGDAARQLVLLRQIDAAVSAAGVILDQDSSPSPSIGLLAGRGDEAPTCLADLRVRRDADFRLAAETLSRQDPDCITLTTATDSSHPLRLHLDHGVDPGPALELRDEVRRAGGVMTRADTRLSSMAVTVDNPDALIALRALTLNPSRWDAPAGMPLTIMSSLDDTRVMDDPPVRALQDAGPLPPAVQTRRPTMTPDLTAWSQRAQT